MSEQAFSSRRSWKGPSPAGDAQRTAQHADPSLLRDEIEIARPLLEGCLNLSDADLVDCIGRATPDHWRLAAARRGFSELVSESIVATGDVPTIEILLCNDSAKISAPAVEVMMAYTREPPLGALAAAPQRTAPQPCLCDVLVVRCL